MTPAPIPRWCLAILAEFTHFVTRVKIVPAVADDVSLTEAERTRGRAFAAKLSMRVLARTWQMLLKGITEVEAAGRPIAAAEMVLVRIAYAADLPTPDEVVRSLNDGARGNGAGSAPSASPSRPEMPARSELPRGGGATRTVGVRDADERARSSQTPKPLSRRGPSRLLKILSRSPPKSAT